MALEINRVKLANGDVNLHCFVKLILHYINAYGVKTSIG